MPALRHGYRIFEPRRRSADDRGGFRLIGDIDGDDSARQRSLSGELRVPRLPRADGVPDKGGSELVFASTRREGKQFQDIVSNIIKSVPFQKMRAPSAEKTGAE